MRHPQSNAVPDLVFRPIGMLLTQKPLDHVLGTAPHSIGDLKALLVSHRLEDLHHLRIESIVLVHHATVIDSSR